MTTEATISPTFSVGDMRTAAIRLAALAMALASWFMLASAPIVRGDADLRNAVNVIAGADATLLGFLVSAGALLYAVAGTSLARNLQRTGHFSRLVGNLFVDAAIFLVALLVGIAALFLSGQGSGGTEAVNALFEAVRVLVALNVLAVVLLIHVGSNLYFLLVSLSPESPGRLED